MARFNFRHGIARRQQDGVGNPSNLQPSNGGSWIDLIVSPDPTVFIIAHFDTDYMITENATVAKAWGPFTTGTDYWLYWDVDFITGELTRGFTVYDPDYGAIPPATPAPDKHWFDTTVNVMKVWTGSSWIEKLRVFAAEYQGGVTIIDYPLGSHVGLNGIPTNVGSILYDPDGNPLQVFQRNRRGQFITTETELHSQFARIANFRIEAAIIQGEAQEHIPIYHAVAFSDFNKLVLARNNVPTRPAIGVATEDMYTGEVRSYITKGFITDEVNWDWSGYPVHTNIYVGTSGQLLAGPDAGAVTQQAIGYTVNHNTIFVDVSPLIEMEPPLYGNELGLLVNRNTGATLARKIPLRMDDLLDVNAGAPTDGDVLVWDTTLGKWILESNCCGGGGGTGQSSAGLFVTGISSPGSGIISNVVYAPDTVPSDVVIIEATSDQETVRIEFLVEGGSSNYSPTVVVDVPTGSPSVGDNVTAVLTQDPADLRTFHGYADITIADGLETGRLVYLESSNGATASVLIKRAPAPPQIQTLLFDSVYPVVAADPTSGYPGGTQTTIKSGDVFYVTGTVENSATLVSLNTGGAVPLGTFTTATAGSSLGAADSGGVGYKTFTIRFTASSASGAQTATATAQNSFGSWGPTSVTVNTVTMDQAAPSVSIGTITYPAGQTALKGSEYATVANTVSGQDYVYYYENGGAGNIIITNPATYETIKLVTRVGGTYVYNGNNFAIKAFKTSNGSSTTVATGDINISTVAPTVAISGASSRLISSPTGQSYTITLTFTQRLQHAPTITSDGDPTAGNRGTWSGSGTTWSFTLTVDDADVKGVYNWTVDNVNTLSNNTYNGVTITAGDTYELGGFTSRLVTVGALEQVVDLMVNLTDPTKVTVKYAGTTDNLTYRGSDLSQFQKGWSAVDGSQLVYTAGPEPYPNYSNYVFQDPSVTPTSWLFLTDAAFAGSNTTGTLQLEIAEAA